jgi:hypothetical protein
MLTLGVRSLTRISRTSKPKAATRPRNYASFEEEPKPSAAQVDPIFNRPASSAGDSQTLPLVEKARALLESRKSGTFTSVSLAGEDVCLGGLNGSLLAPIPEEPNAYMIFSPYAASETHAAFWFGHAIYYDERLPWPAHHCSSN